MSMDLNAKAAYIRGMMAGMEFDASSPSGKVIAAMMDLLEQMAAEVTEQGQGLEELSRDVTEMDADIDELVSAVFEEPLDDYDEEDEEDAGDEDAVYEVTCPNCNAVTTVDEETLLREELVCPNCGAAFDIELEGEEESKPDSIFVMPEELDDDES